MNFLSEIQACNNNSICLRCGAILGCHHYGDSVVTYSQRDGDIVAAIDRKAGVVVARGRRDIDAVAVVWHGGGVIGHRWAECRVKRPASYRQG